MTSNMNTGILLSEVISKESDSAFGKHRHSTNLNDEKFNLEYADAGDEWAGVTTVEMSLPDANVIPVHQSKVEASPNIATEEAIDYFKSFDLSQMDGETPRDEHRRLGGCSLFSCLFGPPHLHKNLKQEKDLVFSIAKCDFESSNDVHWRMLQTVYKQFTGDVFDCPRIGNHWQIIGFQGTDPGTDFRGVGMFGLLQLLFLTTSPQLNRFTKDLYKTSVDERQNFPLAVLSLNITCIALQALRHGELHKECNRQHVVIGVVNEYYAAVLYHFLKDYSSQNKTIKDTGYLLKDIERYCRNNVRATFRTLRNFTATQSEIKENAENITPFVKGSFQDISLS